MITFYDGIMLLIVIVAILQGAWRGMAWQLAPIASLILGYVISYPASITLAQYFGKPPLNRLWAMIAVYLGVSLFVYMVARSVRHSLEKMRLVEFDRHLGALLGGVKGILFTVALTIGLITISDQAREIILKSESSTISARLMNTISPILPDALNELVHPYLKNLNDQLPEIADNPTYTLPKPPVLIPNRIATQDRLARPRRFSDEQEAPTSPRRPPANDFLDDDFSVPEIPDRNASPLPGTPRVPSRPAPDDELDVPQPARRETPSRESASPSVPLPPVNEVDDFFGADPDEALKQKNPARPR